MRESTTDTLIARGYSWLTGARHGNAPSGSEARNGAIHVASLSLTKTADGLIDPKLVLAWLLHAVGAPAVFVGLLVPVREAGSLLPQLLLAGPVERSERRKTFWSFGSFLQGGAALGIATSATWLSGAAAGSAILGCLALLAMARAFASVSYKDALARTIPKARRGSLTGAASSVAAVAVLVFGGLLATGVLPLTVTSLSAAVALAGLLWIAAATLFLALKETGSVRGDGAVETSLLEPVSDPQFRLFVSVRALLTATAFAPPFLVLLSARGSDGGLGDLGPFVLASSAASILSGYLWGRLSDRSSRLTLAASGTLAAVTLAAAGGTGMTTGGLGSLPVAVVMIFAAQVAYEGVRAGRKLHLTDMAGDDARARYTALSNTMIGAVLLAGGVLGLLADAAGPDVVLLVLAVAALVAIPLALLLDEVQTSA